MKVIFFNWLASMGVEVSNMMALVIALGFIVLTSLILHVLLHRVLLVRLVTVLAKSKQVWLPPQLQQRLFYRLAFVLQGAVMLGQAEIWLPSGSDSLQLIEMVTQFWILLFLLLALFGFKVDKEANNAAVLGGEGPITAEGSRLALVMPTNEELVIARDALSLVG